MSATRSRSWEIFFEVYEALPRQGPGNFDSAARTVRLCGELPPSRAVLDLGCGVGGQTLSLAKLTSGSTVEPAAEAEGLRDYTARTEVESSAAFGSLADKLRGALDTRRK